MTLASVMLVRATTPFTLHVMIPGAPLTPGIPEHLSKDLKKDLAQIHISSHDLKAPSVHHIDSDHDQALILSVPR